MSELLEVLPILCFIYLFYIYLCACTMQACLHVGLLEGTIYHLLKISIDIFSYCLPLWPFFFFLGTCLANGQRDFFSAYLLNPCSIFLLTFGHLYCGLYCACRLLISLLMYCGQNINLLNEYNCWKNGFFWPHQYILVTRWSKW